MVEVRFLVPAPVYEESSMKYKSKLCKEYVEFLERKVKDQEKQINEYKASEKDMIESLK